MKYAIIDVISCESCPFHNHLRVINSSWCIAPYREAPREIDPLEAAFFPSWCPLDDDCDT